MDNWGHGDNSNVNKCKIARDDIIKNIKNLKKGTSPGCDGITSEHLIPLLDRVLKSGANPLKVIFDKEFSITSKSNLNREEDGLVDSLRFLLNHDNYNKPKSDEHILVTLLTKAF